MGYTNSTTNYHLPQFIGTDKPSWLGDVNSAMSAIDTQMKVNASDIDSLESRMTATETVANSASTAATNAGNAASAAQSTADSAASAASSAGTAASNAQSTANTAQTAASTADGKAVTAQSTATSALTKANANEAAIAKFNLTSFESPDTTTSNIGSVTYSDMAIAKNSDGSLAKIYGRAIVGNFSIASGYQACHVSFPSSLRPTTSFTINCAGIFCLRNNQAEEYTSQLSITIGTDGTITTSDFNCFPDTANVTLLLFPCLYWVKDFGDVPVTPDN